MTNNAIYVMLSYETLFFYLLCFLNRKERTFLRRKLLKLVPIGIYHLYLKYTKFNVMSCSAKKNFVSYPPGQNSQMQSHVPHQFLMHVRFQWAFRSFSSIFFLIDKTAL